MVVWGVQTRIYGWMYILLVEREAWLEVVLAWYVAYHVLYWAIPFKREGGE